MGTGRSPIVMDNGKLRATAPYIALLLMAALAIPIFFAAGWFGELPAAHVYSGHLSFSGENAMTDVRTLSARFEGRVAGTRAARTSAEWVGQRFREVGIEARIEEFECLSKETAVRQDQRTQVPVSALTYEATGYNVVAVSPGRSPNAVVFGAHRDVSGDIQGAEDNASGTASLMELARVLCAEEHEYTYVFVSYDGEEQGLRGSEAFAAANSPLPVKLAISLDMTGFSEASTVGFYPFVSSRSASPLWTVALAHAVSRANDLPVFQFGASEEVSLNPAVTFWRVRKERTAARVPTDTGPFVDRGIPSLGVMAVATTGGQGRMAVIHGPRDTIEQVSAQSLERTGRYVEQYVRSLEANEFSGTAVSRLYLVSRDKVLSPVAVHGLTVYSLALAGAFAALSWRDSVRRHGLTAFLGFLKAERLSIALALTVAAASAAFPSLVRSSVLSRSFTIIGFNVLWGAVTVLGLAAVTVFRQRTLNRSDRLYHETTAGQKALMNLIYVLSFASLLPLSGPFTAMEASIFPILVLGRINFRSQESRALWSFSAIAWIAYGFFTMRARVSTAAFNPVIGRALLADFARILTWSVTAVFMFSAPRRGAKAEDSHG